jgi:fructokinase
MHALKHQCLLVCEILWDCFPDQERLGGATLNVAYHLKHCGVDPLIASSVGDDRWGEAARRQIERWGCETRAIRVLPGIPTGRAMVTLDEKGDGHYEILTPAAWDFVSLEPNVLRNTRDIKAFVYGSVALRSEFNREQIDGFLEKFAGLKCFDVNFRPPHNTRELILSYAAKADFVKMNEEELKMLLGSGDEEESIETQMRELATILGVELLCVTRAERSALLLKGDTLFQGKIFPVDVEDTVGAGDAFFASMIGELLSQTFDPVEALDRATEIGSWVASKKGAQPAYPDTPIGEGTL